MFGLSSLRKSEAMGREYGSVKAPSAHGSWNKWAVDIDWRRRGAKSSTAMSGPQGKFIGRAAVKPSMAAAGKTSVFCTPRTLDFPCEPSSYNRRSLATSLQSSSRPGGSELGCTTGKQEPGKRQIDQRIGLCRESSLRRRVFPSVRRALPIMAEP